MTWVEVRKDVCFNRILILVMWILLLLDCIVIHGCVRSNYELKIKETDKKVNDLIDKVAKIEENQKEVPEYKTLPHKHNYSDGGVM